MDKTFDPKIIEQQCYTQWEQAGYFKPTGNGQPYCIMLPPPNVTGTLHMGHGFQQTIMDALIRYHRMCGDNTLWQAGTDHAGIATQLVVERQLAAQQTSRHDLGRDAFIEKVWEWKHISDTTIKNQMRRLGTSMDWERARFTLDEDISAAVYKVFIDLYNEGLIYRGKRLVNWDPVLLTAISDLEVITEEHQGFLWHIRYPIADTDESIIVATTRPETLLGDVAVAVHPDDERYQHLIGKQVALPFTERTIPIIADTAVLAEFGTGCVKITPAHDFNDYAMAQRHQLPMINILTPDAHINDNAPTEYRGLERFAARKQIIKDLTAKELLVKTEPYVIKIPKGDRSGAIIEPYLTDQWFMRMESLAAPALAAVKNGDIKFVPENWEKIYFQWLENIQDWCISRQLWWGHRIPAWYDKAGNVYVGCSEGEVREKYKLSTDFNLTQDNDVLDTWFSSALWPFATLGWPENTAEFNTFYATDVLVTGFDIIFFWVARMIMLGLKFTGKIPFKDVYVTGLIRDSEGQKMSKSKGNILDPLDLIDGITLNELVIKRTSNLMQPELAQKIEKNTRKEFPEGIPAFGTDALRFTFCALATFGRDINFDLNRLMGNRNFCNKLWNAARFVLMNVEGQTFTQAPTQLTAIDIWMTYRLQEAVQAAHTKFAEYHFDHLTQNLYDLVWNIYCDWYVEFTKSTSEYSTKYTLIHTLETILRLLHPLMPFITETIWQQLAPLLGKENQSIMMQPYPSADTKFIADAKNQQACTETEWLKQVITSIRTIRSEKNISPAKRLSLVVAQGTADDKQRITAYKTFILSLAKLDDINWNDNPPPAYTAFVGELKLCISMAEAMDKPAELQRLHREIEKINKEFQQLEGRLYNPGFVSKAPAAVVEQERAKLAELNLKRSKYVEELAIIEKL